MPLAAIAVVFPKLETKVTFQRRAMFAASSRLGISNCCHAFCFCFSVVEVKATEVHR